MGECVIRVRIDLLIRLIDTTTGSSVNEVNVSFTKDGVQQRPQYKGDGNFIFINTGRVNGLMHIKAYGYEEKDVLIDYEKLGENTPESDVFLIPSESTVKGEPVISISGKLPSLESVDAINVLRPLCNFAEYNQKKREISVFGYVAGKDVKLDDRYYGMTKMDEKSYDSFVVAQQSGDNKAVLEEPLQSEAKPNQKIYRLLFGDVKDDGSFVFRVRDDATEIRYMLRFVAAGDTYFRVIDFRKTYGEIDLMEDAVKLEVETPQDETSNDSEGKKEET